MGTFETTTQTRLRVVPTKAVRADIDVRTGAGAVGQALGQGLLGVGAAGIELFKRRQDMEDTRSAVTANSLVKTVVDENRAFRETTTDTKAWAKDLQERLTRAESQIGTLPMSDDARALQGVKFQASSREATANSLVAETTREADDTRGAVILDVTESVRSGSEQDKADATKRFTAIAPSLWDESEARTIFATAVKAGQKGRTDDLINNVHAAMEEGSISGNFETVRVLATDPNIPEKQQTTLRNAINAAENTKTAKVKDEQTRIVNETTTQTINEYYNNTLTIAALDQRHKAGLIKDAAFTTMIEGLQEIAPKASDPFAKGAIRRATAKLQEGSISREDADEVILANYLRLDTTDRSDVVANLEEATTKAIATAKSNAYNEGVGLMSEQFVGIKDAEDILQVLLGAKGLTEEEKEKTNRRFTAEVNNRDLYERAVEERFREMRAKDISDVRQYNSESLRILLQYQKRKQLDLEQLEVAVGVEQKGIVAGDVNELTADEARAELTRRRALRGK